MRSRRSEQELTEAIATREIVQPLGLRWLVRKDGSRVLQQMIELRHGLTAWVDVKEVESNADQS